MIDFEVHGQGPALVLLHGVGLDRSVWERCLPALATEHRVILPDLRGHGRSPRIEGGITLAELASDVAEILDRPAHIVGFSLGAMVASELALSHGDLVSFLTLVSSVVNRSESEREAVRERLALAEDDFERSAQAAVDRWIDPALHAEEPDLARRMRAIMLANDRRSYLAAYRVFTEADAELWPRLPHIRVPTLAMTGEQDPGSTPKMTRRLARIIPNARSEIISGARHLLPLQCPDELVRLIIAQERRARKMNKEKRWQPPHYSATKTT